MVACFTGRGRTIRIPFFTDAVLRPVLRQRMGPPSAGRAWLCPRAVADATDGAGTVADRTTAGWATSTGWATSQLGLIKAEADTVDGTTFGGKR